MPRRVRSPGAEAGEDGGAARPRAPGASWAARGRLRAGCAEGRLSAASVLLGAREGAGLCGRDQASPEFLDEVLAGGLRKWSR